jgi:cytidylate kinase
LAARGIPVNIDALREEIRVRDQMNETRAVSPLRRAEDAHLLDTTNLTLDEVVDRVVALAQGNA